MKKARLTIVIVFIAFLVLISGGSLLMKDRKFSPNENRYLAEPPKLSVDNILSGRFQDGLEDYLRDQICFRDEWITIKTGIQKACGDNKNIFKLVIMHSEVATNLENLRLLKYMTYTDKDGIQRDLAIGTWNGRTVLVDDNMPVEEVAESAEGKNDGYTKYTSYILGEGSIILDDIGDANP